tara:strand:- start:15306 stop:15755 length:450 start_codon:yes stop_codon:yes gene_type:complete
MNFLVGALVFCEVILGSGQDTKRKSIVGEVRDKNLKVKYLTDEEKVFPVEYERLTIQDKNKQIFIVDSNACKSIDEKVSIDEFIQKQKDRKLKKAIEKARKEKKDLIVREKDKEEKIQTESPKEETELEESKIKNNPDKTDEEKFLNDL